jgi:hypothetical protein
MRSKHGIFITIILHKKGLFETWGKNYINKDHKFKHTLKKSRNVFFFKYNNDFLDFPKKFKEENQLGSVLQGSIEIF